MQMNRFTEKIATKSFQILFNYFFHLFIYFYLFIFILLFLFIIYLFIYLFSYIFNFVAMTSLTKMAACSVAFSSSSKPSIIISYYQPILILFHPTTQLNRRFIL